MIRHKASKTAKTDKKRAYRFGHLGEEAACWLLRAKGYRIRARRLRTYFGEIDILASRANTLVAVEVKARRNKATLAEAVTPAQQERIVRAMQQLQADPHYAIYKVGKSAGLIPQTPPNMRFDVIWVRPWAWPVHMIDAWRL